MTNFLVYIFWEKVAALPFLPWDLFAFREYVHWSDPNLAMSLTVKILSPNPVVISVLTLGQ